jgi:hypothetical protein
MLLRDPVPEAPMLRYLLSTALIALAALSLRAQDLPLESCDRLPALTLRISGAKFFFLVDTGATSMLNLSSFPRGDSKDVRITSWNGTMKTRARQIEVADLELGGNHLKNVKLPAVDLSHVSRACGKLLDGILGIDLLAAFGVTIDVPNRIVHVRPETPCTKPPRQGHR